MEAKGKQRLWEQKKPEVLKTLKEIALIQSAESSNRIEGVEIDRKRLKPIVLENSHPKTRPEEEILGYRRSLDLIHSQHGNIVINEEVIQKIHNIAQEGVHDSGKWKQKNNEIIEFDHQGRRSVRFVPTEAEHVPLQMEQLCLAYNNQIRDTHLPALIVCALFVLDFLCIHPFRDGNGRVSRLLSLLLLYHQGFHVGKYVSLERIIEENKDEYYEALKKSSLGWHDSNHDVLPWTHFFLSTLRLAYKEFAQKVELTESESTGKGEIVEKSILEQVGAFTLKDIQSLCPNVSEQMIKKVLSDLKKQNKISLTGRGRGAKWKVI